jgi:hypothetical protein
MSDRLPYNLRWTSADLDRMTPGQIKRLTERGELNHLLAGNELTQQEADALKDEYRKEQGKGS